MVRFAAVAEFQMPPPYLWRACQLVKEKSHSCKIQSGCFYLLDERFRSHPYAVFQFVTSECFASHGRAAGPPLLSSGCSPDRQGMLYTRPLSPTALTLP